MDWTSHDVWLGMKPGVCCVAGCVRYFSLSNTAMTNNQSLHHWFLLATTKQPTNPMS